MPAKAPQLGSVSGELLHRRQMRASRIMLNGVSVARRTRPSPSALLGHNPGAIGLQRLADMRGGAGPVAVEERHRSNPLPGTSLALATSKRVLASTPCSCACGRAFSIELGSWPKRGTHVPGLAARLGDDGVAQDMPASCSAYGCRPDSEDRECVARARCGSR